MIFNLITCIPLSINPCRREIYLTFLKEDPPAWAHVIITAVLLWLTAVIGTAFPHVINAFGILGGFMAVPIVIYYPGMLYLKFGEGKFWKTPSKIFTLIMTIILSIVGLGAALISLL